MRNEKYSFGDFTGMTLKDRPAFEFNNTEIVGSCFAQISDSREDVKTLEDVAIDIFPDGMTGVHFVRCNLDNVYIPDGNTYKTDGWDKCSHRLIVNEPDGEDWEVDDKLKPVKATTEKGLIREGKNYDKTKIPKHRVGKKNGKRDETKARGWKPPKKGKHAEGGN